MLVAGDRYRLQTALHVGLGLSDTHALSHLHARGALTQGELARLVGVWTSGATVLIDRRRVQIELTTAGRDILTESSDRLRHAFDHIGSAQLAGVADHLVTIAADLTEQAAALRDRWNASREAPVEPAQD